MVTTKFATLVPIGSAGRRWMRAPPPLVASHLQCVKIGAGHVRRGRGEWRRQQGVKEERNQIGRGEGLGGRAAGQGGSGLGALRA